MFKMELTLSHHSKRRCQGNVTLCKGTSVTGLKKFQSLAYRLQFLQLVIIPTATTLSFAIHKLIVTIIVIMMKCNKLCQGQRTDTTITLQVAP